MPQAKPDDVVQVVLEGVTMTRGTQLGVEMFMRHHGVEHAHVFQSHNSSLGWNYAHCEISARDWFRLSLRYHSVPDAIREYINDNCGQLYRQLVSQLGESAGSDDA